MRVPASVEFDARAEGRRPERQPEGRIGVERGASGVLGPLPIDVRQPRRRRHADIRSAFVRRGQRRHAGGAGTGTVEPEQRDRRRRRAHRRHDCRRRPTPTRAGPGRQGRRWRSASMRSACARTIASWSCASFRRSRSSISYLAPSLSPIEAFAPRRSRTAVRAATRSGTAADAPAAVESARRRIDAAPQWR